MCFSNPSLAIAAVTIGSYDRLAFLGDALLDAVLTHEIYKAFPEWDERQLSGARDALQCNAWFAQLTISHAVSGPAVEVFAMAVWQQHGYLSMRYVSDARRVTWLESGMSIYHFASEPFVSSTSSSSSSSSSTFVMTRTGNSERVTRAFKIE